MAVDDREPHQERPDELPRRVPGVNGRTPGQIRRGYLPIPGTPSPAAIQSPPETAQRPRLPEPLSAESMATARPSPTALASSAAKLLSGTAAAAAPPVPAARPTSPPGRVPPQLATLPGIVPPATVSPSGTPPPPVVAQPADTSAAQPAQPGTKQRTTPKARPARRWRLAGFLIVVAVVTVVVVITLGIRHSPAVTAGPGKPGAAQGTTPGGQQISAEAAVRARAVTWVAGQVGRDIIIACDSVICSDLAQHGFPAGNLNVLQPTAPDPYGSELVIATADVRSQFGSKLAAVYAPEVIASFGTGAGKIEVRVIAPRGPAAFQSALRADLLNRKSSGAQLLRNRRIQAPAAARAQLAAGRVDERLLTIIAFMAAGQPLDIVDFGGIAPGASPSVPLRFADLAVANPAAQLARPAYQRALIALAHSEVPPYVPLSVGTVRLADGRTVLRIEFAAPSPAGLPS